MNNPSTKTHPLIQSWSQGQATLNGWLSLANSFTTEIMAQQGFDSLTIDMQHGISDYSDLLNMLPPIQATETPALVRIPWLSADHVMKTLDAGASGIICPMVNTQTDAEALVRYAYYPPQGERSFGPIRAKWVYGNDYAQTANNNLLIIAMIETQQALDNLDAIMGVEGIDAVYIGPADLSFNLGLNPQFDQTAPEFMQALDLIIAKAKQHGKFLGIHNGSVEYAKQMLARGFDFVTVGADAGFIALGAASVVKSFRT